MRTWKPTLSLFLCIVFLTAILHPLPTYSETHNRFQPVASKPFSPPLKKWILDEAKGYIYAVRDRLNHADNYKLVYIRTSDLQVEREVVLPHRPTDMEQQADKLYLSYPNTPVLEVLDLAKGQITQTFNIMQPAKSIALDGDKLFYINEAGALRQYEISSQKEKEIPFPYIFGADLTVDPQNHLLYIGSTGISLSQLQVISTIDGSSRGQSIPLHTFSDSPLLNGGQLFYAGHRFSTEDLRVIEGKYQDASQTYYSDRVFAANSKLVVGQSAVFDRDTFVKLADLPVRAELALADSHDQVYVFGDHQLVKGTVQQGGPSPAFSISAWELDETNGYIYAVSKQTNQLLWIRTNDLSIEKTLTIGSQPSDMDQVGNKLYIALEGSNQVPVVDLLSKTVESTIAVANLPSRIAVDSNHIYYVQHILSGSPLYKHDRSTDQDSMVLAEGSTYDSYSRAELTIDREKQKLYVAEAGSNGFLSVFRTTDQKRIQHATYGDSWTTFSAGVKLDQEDLFYAGRKASASNPSQIHGNYGESILAVHDEIVVSHQSIYDRATYVKVGELPFQSSQFLLDSNQQAYWFDASNRAIRKTQLQIRPQGGNVSKGTMDQLMLSHKLTDWSYDSELDKIFAISKDSNRLLFIRPEDLTVEKDLWIGSNPTDIEIYQGKLYVALGGATKVAVLNTHGTGEITHIQLDARPSQIEVGSGGLFYASAEKSDRIRHYDFQSEQSKPIHFTDTWLPWDKPDLLWDHEHNTLYIGQFTGTEANLYAVDAVNFNLKDQHTIKRSYHWPKSARLVKAGNQLFYANTVRDSQNLKESTWYSANKVLFGKDHLLIEENGLYDLNMGLLKIALPYQADQAVMDTRGHYFVYHDQQQTIYRYRSPQEMKANRPESVAWELNSAKDQLKLTWEPVSGAAGYNVYFKFRSEPAPVKLNNNPLSAPSYTVTTDINYNWHSDAVLFGVTAIVGGKETALSDLYAFQYHRQFSKTSGDLITSDLVAENTFHDMMADEHVALVRVDEQAFNQYLDEHLGQSETFELRIKSYADRIRMELPGTSYMKLKNSGMNFKIISQNGAYILPTDASTLPILDMPQNSTIPIEIRRIKGTEQKEFEQTAQTAGHQIISDLTDFSVTVQDQKETILVHSYGSKYVDRWIPLEEKPNESSSVGIVYDPATRSYRPVPTQFFQDEHSQWWAVLKRNGNSAYSVIQSSVTFPDVQKHWAKPDIELLASKQIVKGISKLQFSPNEKVTRAQFVTLLTQALALSDMKKSSHTPFKDVTNTDWYATSITAALDANLTKGYADGSFRPNQTINREQMVVMAISALEYVQGKQAADLSILQGFTDEKTVSPWAKEAVAQAVQARLVKGWPDGTFKPHAVATRAESVVVLKNLLKQLEFIGLDK